MSDIPDTDEPRVAALAIAWEIVKPWRDYKALKALLSGDELAKETTNKLIEVYKAIYKQEPIS